LNFQDINLLIQTTLLAVVLVSMWFRVKGNYLVHGATMIGAVAAQLIGLIVVLATTPSSAMEPITSVPLNMSMFAVHAFFGAASVGAGVVLVALWRPKSTTFPAKSKRIAQLTAILWVSTFVIGIVLGLTLHTGFFI
jgi:uncharacterized membrane protein YozB (DUF420 family)